MVEHLRLEPPPLRGVLLKTQKKDALFLLFFKVYLKAIFIIVVSHDQAVFAQIFSLFFDILQRGREE